jgi:hypothetical protein
MKFGSFLLPPNDPSLAPANDARMRQKRDLCNVQTAGFPSESRAIIHSTSR